MRPKNLVDGIFNRSLVSLGAVLELEITATDLAPEAVEARRVARAERRAEWERECAQHLSDKAERERPVMEAAANKRALKNAKRVAAIRPAPGRDPSRD
jgi:hypothetical protein